MLITPLGELIVLKNNIPIEYNLIKLPLKPIDICSYKVDERYLIEIDKSTIKCGDTISYTVNTDIKPEKDIGECLIEAMFESDEMFLGIGGYDLNEQDETCNFGHGFYIIENGIAVKIKDLKYIEDLLVAISWCNTSEEDFILLYGSVQIQLFRNLYLYKHKKLKVFINFLFLCN